MSRREAADLGRATAPELAAAERQYFNASRADGAAGSTATGVRWWRKFTAQIGVPEEQRAAAGDQTALRYVEGLRMRFAVWLLEVRSVTVETVRKYLGAQSSWHEVEYGEMTPGYRQPRLARLLQGMEKVKGVPPRKPRLGVRPQELAKALDVLFPRGRPTAVAANVRAALVVALCGLLRAAEFSLEPGAVWSSVHHLSRADVSFRRVRDDDGTSVVEAVLMMRPCKKLKYAAGKTVPVVLRDGSVLQPVRELLSLFVHDPVDAAARSSVPLFRGSAGGAFTTAYVRGLVKVVMKVAGRNPVLFGAHSLRIGGASALLAANVPAAVIQVMGRWDSDVYQVYCRWSAASARRAGTAVASTPYEDFEGEYQYEELY